MITHFFEPHSDFTHELRNCAVLVIRARCVNEDHREVVVGMRSSESLDICCARLHPMADDLNLPVSSPFNKLCVGDLDIT